MCEAKFTPGLTTDAVFEHATEIAEGLWRNCETAVGRDRSWTIVSNGDLMFLIDAYREALWGLLNRKTHE
jgi:hypothetical protein